MTYFFLKSVTDSISISLEFMTADGTLIKKFATDAKEKKDQMEVKEGVNRFVWNMRYSDAESFKGLIMWAGRVTGPMAMPGKYKVKLTVEGQSMESDFEILADPRSKATPQDYQAQFDYLISVRDKVSETHLAIKQIREVRKQINGVTESLKDKDGMDGLTDDAKDILERMKTIEEALYQTQNQSGQDPLNFPIRLNNKLAHLSGQVGQGDYPPTEQAVAFKKEVTADIDAELGQLKQIMTQDIPALNQMIKDAGTDFINAEPAEPVN